MVNLLHVQLQTPGVKAKGLPAHGASSSWASLGSLDSLLALQEKVPH